MDTTKDLANLIAQAGRDLRAGKITADGYRDVIGPLMDRPDYTQAKFLAATITHR